MHLPPPHLHEDDEDRLWNALWTGDDATARSILDPLVAEPETDVCQGRGVTALHVAAMRGWSDLVARLLEADADVNMSTGGGCGDLVGKTPLHEACYGGRAAICSVLIEAGADVNAWQAEARIRGMVRGGLAIASERGHLATVSVLLGAGADPNGTPFRHARPLDLEHVSLIRPLPVAIARGHAEVASLLIDHGADLDLESAHDGRSKPRESARTLIAESKDLRIQGLL